MQNKLPAALVEDHTPLPLPDPPLAQDRDTGNSPAHHRSPGHLPFRLNNASSRSSLANSFWYVEPSWRNYIHYVDLEARQGNLDAARFVARWREMNCFEKEAHTPEQLCGEVKVSHSDLKRWVQDNFVAEGSSRASMCLSLFKSDVIEKTAEFAMSSSDNYHHTRMFLEAANVLPTNGKSHPGARFLNQVIASSGSVAGVSSESGPVDRSGLRDMDDDIVELSTIMQTGGTACKAEDLDDGPDDDDDDDDDE